jgi:hypothetical protein
MGEIRDGMSMESGRDLDRNRSAAGNVLAAQRGATGLAQFDTNPLEGSRQSTMDPFRIRVQCAGDAWSQRQRGCPLFEFAKT